MFFDLWFVLTGTISENIAMGKTTSVATQADIEHAAKAANAHDFIMKIGGYDVDVGPGGSKLSGTLASRLKSVCGQCGHVLVVLFWLYFV